MNSLPELTRRNFLGAAAASVAVGTIADAHRAMAADEDGAPLVIDCHAHIYSEDEKTYPPIADPYRPPAGKGTVSHLKREMKANGVRYVTAIHTSTFYKWDNRFTTDAARDNADIMVGVCTLNPDDPASPKLLEEYVKTKNVRGMRSIPAQSGKLDDPGVEALWATAERLGVVINALVNRDKRTEIEMLVGRHPHLRVVIDHCLNLKAGPTLEPTLGDMLALASLPNVYAKLTFIPTGSAERYPCRDMHDACRAVIKEFGADHCVWGSDFPCELWCKESQITYAQHLAIFTRELGLDAESKKEILGATAYRLWFKPLSSSR
ncbi:MAG: amidohydrolase family protein [Planctomycetaceae bacterium]